MGQRPITNELLNLVIESKLEAGVSRSEINALLYAFCPDEGCREAFGNIIGFFEVDDVPQQARAAFLTSLLALSGRHGEVVASVRQASGGRPASHAVSKIFYIFKTLYTPIRERSAQAIKRSTGRSASLLAAN